MFLSAVILFAQEELSIPEVFSQNNNAVVYITQALHFKKADVLNLDLFQRFENILEVEILDSYFPLSSGTGFIITNDAYLITNNHVIDKQNLGDLKTVLEQGTTKWLTEKLPDMGFIRKEITTIIADFTRLINNSTFHYRVKTYDKQEYNAEVIAKDSDVDLALLKLETAERFNIVVFNDVEEITVGDSVVAIGYPLQNSIESFLKDFQPTLSTGIISALRSDTWGIQHTASINPGNSGGPLFNGQGNLIGVNVGGVEGANDIYFSIPLKKLITFLKDNDKTELIDKNNSGLRMSDSGEMVEQKPLEVGTSLLIKDAETSQVYLDEKLKGTPPVLLENMAAGEHTLRLESENQFHQRTILVNEAIKTIKEYNPVLQYYSGNLFIKTEPPQAEVVIDDTSYGESPCVVSNLNVGSHKLLLRYKGFADFEKDIEVLKDQTVSLTFSLEKLYLLSLTPEPETGTTIIIKQGSITKQFTFDRGSD